MGGKCSKNEKHVKSVQNFSRETCMKETTWKPQANRGGYHSDIKDAECSMRTEFSWLWLQLIDKFV
jgi:hypothetical protein